MSSNTENIEAKLCAYVDGDLDEAGRVEIEKHLQSNPQHRLLLEELKQTKIMMQSLPREVAPPELSETIHGQLEHSVLLDGVGTEDVAATMKINRFPQLMAVAAVLVLASGLGVLVWVVLPKHANQTIAFTPAEVKTDAQASPTAKLQAEFAKNVGDKELGPVGMKGEAEGLKFPENGDEAAGLRRRADGFAGKGGGLTLKAAVKDAAADEVFHAAKEKDTVASATPRRVYVVLTTDSLTTTNGQVASYLESNKIAWAPGDANLQQVWSPSRLASTTVVTNTGVFPEGNNNTVAANVGNNTYGNAAPGGGGGKVGDSGNVYNGGRSATMSKTGEPVQQQRQELNSNNDNYRQAYNSNQQRMNDQPGAGQQAAAPAPVQPQQAQSPQAQAKPYGGQGQGGQGDTLNNQSGQQLAQQRPIEAFDLAKSSSENVIVAKGLTREQAVLMCDTLGKLYAGQTAVVVDDREKAEDLSRLVQLNRQVMREVDAPTSRPSTQPATLQPEGDPRSWAKAMEDAKENKQAITEEAKSTTQPTAGPALPPVPELAAPSTQPADGATAAAGVSQPAFERQGADMDLNAATTRPAEAVEVVIVVQPATANPPPAAGVPNDAVAPNDATAATNPATAVPTTQPAGTEPPPNAAEQPSPAAK